MINFSVIIPHRNTPDLLKRCLDSIPVRSDLEIIVVDDASDSEIVDFNKFPGSDRSDVKIVFSKKSGGGGFARNLGLEHAIGKWLLFADADDCFIDSQLTILLDLYANDDKTDMVFLNAVGFNESAQKIPLILSRYIRNYEKKKIFSEKVLRYGFWAPWSRMVKRSLVEAYSLKFEEVPVGNDIMFILFCSKIAKTIDIYTPICYMYYKPSGGSQTHTAAKQQKVNVLVEKNIKVNSFYHEVSYPFRWPIARALKRYTFKEKIYFLYNLKKVRKYNFFSDLYYTLIFLLAKLLKIL